MKQVKSTDSMLDTYLKKRRRYFNLLDKTHKLAPTHLLDGSFAGVQQYCQAVLFFQKIPGDFNLRLITRGL